MDIEEYRGLTRDLTTVLEKRNAEIERLRAGFRAIRKATIDGRVCDDVAWFDDITTLHDFCDQNAHC